ncbi:GntR family transcriptional regulator [Streptomyces sp. NBC_01429]|uniref:GntR family transcriptional regulator n=1 Tax=Streptomyces sp. NBC_01429 TaxID=2903862 RepID=UPI002E2E3402|nr:GntR family transcriptional regulator [Streptomyces sp. NBC_01429]
MQVADTLSGAITAGQHEPGSLLPSETRLMARFGISRPTARAAVGELRARGLVESRHGRGTFVRSTGLPATVVGRSITQQGQRYGQDWEGVEAEYPAVTRGHATGVEAELLARDEEAVFVAERLLTDRATRVRASHSTLIPFDTAEEVPALAKSPDMAPTAIYDALAAAGHKLTWTERVTARSPRPDERAALGMSDSSPILITYRVTATATGRPLILEKLSISADQAQLSYRISPTKVTKRRGPV